MSLEIILINQKFFEYYLNFPKNLQKRKTQLRLWPQTDSMVPDNFLTPSSQLPDNANKQRKHKIRAQTSKYGVGITGILKKKKSVRNTV